jgi:hypothetical protein
MLPRTTTVASSFIIMARPRVMRRAPGKLRAGWRKGPLKFFKIEIFPANRKIMSVVFI